MNQNEESADVQTSVSSLHDALLDIRHVARVLHGVEDTGSLSIEEIVSLCSILNRVGELVAEASERNHNTQVQTP